LLQTEEQAASLRLSEELEEKHPVSCVVLIAPVGMVLARWLHIPLSWLAIQARGKDRDQDTDNR